MRSVYTHFSVDCWCWIYYFWVYHSSSSVYDIDTTNKFDLPFYYLVYYYLRYLNTLGFVWFYYCYHRFLVERENYVSKFSFSPCPHQLSPPFLPDCSQYSLDTIFSYFLIFVIWHHRGIAKLVALRFCWIEAWLSDSHIYLQRMVMIWLWFWKVILLWYAILQSTLCTIKCIHFVKSWLHLDTLEKNPNMPLPPKNPNLLPKKPTNKQKTPTQPYKDKQQSLSY